jgi:hypothetical protein
MVRGNNYEFSYHFYLSFASYTSALLSAFTGNFAPAYLFCFIRIIVGGTGINTFFILYPTPKRADMVNRIPFMIPGGLYVLSMIPGKG